MKRLILLSLCFLFVFSFCKAERISFSDGYVLQASIYRVDGDLISSSKMSLQLRNNESTARSLIEEALKNCSFLRLSGIECGNQVYTVLLAKTAAASEDKIALFSFAIAQTLMNNNVCEGVNLLIDGVCPEIDGIPLNTICAKFTNSLTLSSAVEQHIKTRRTTFYLPDSSGKYIVAVLSSESGEDFKYSGLLKKYGHVTFDTSVLRWFPAGYDLYDLFAVSSEYNSSGRKVIYLKCRDSSKLDEAFKASKIEKWQFLAALCYTFNDNCPGTERVKVFIDDNPVAALPTYNGAIVNVENSEMSRLFFSGRLGAIRRGYENGSRETLVQKSIVLPCQSMNDPVRIIETCVPDVNAGDVLDAYISGQEAYISLSNRFYTKTKSLSLTQAHKVYYAIVNTLYENLGIRRVMFLHDSQLAGVLSCGLDLSNFLYPDFGLGS
ncbi:MAG: hypothetical protein K5663_08895 [Clostridiales bacterium]|nr:hypothetical protein [Clostridiales bacterium]